jgi:hypothetical protein
LQLARSPAIEADLAVRVHLGCSQAGAKRKLHVQQRVEATAVQRRTQGAVRGTTTSLVEHDELDTGQVPEQLVLELADDPGEFHQGPSVLQRADDRHDVAHVAERGKPQQADRSGR